jgi:two-component system, cell cycle sensor histidine kinase and response regulator CckA
MKAGAHDYVMKGNLRRLVPALRRELQEAASREALRESARALKQAQKMEAVGRLAGGVAHDFNNLLCAITGFTELALEELPDREAVRQSLQEVLKAAERGAALTRQLLSLGQRQSQPAQVLSVNETVRDLDRMLRRVLPSTVSLELALDAVPDSVLISADELCQVVLNLVINARDAMPHGGSLEVSTENVGDRVCLTVSDTGTGMSEEVSARIFEPFFTTKEPGKGTGLGLSSVYGIVHQSHGEISVETAEGEGSTFRLNWPCAVPQAPAAPAEVVAQALSRREDHTILVVDDTEQVRDVLARLLHHQGYRVIQAADGQQALNVDPQTFDLAIIDMVMPGIKGGELARRLRRRRPTLKIILTSGYGSDLEGVEVGDKFLPKPTPPAQLFNVVRDVLAG